MIHIRLCDVYLIAWVTVLSQRRQIHFVCQRLIWKAIKVLHIIMSIQGCFHRILCTLLMLKCNWDIFISGCNFIEVILRSVNPSLLLARIILLCALADYHGHLGNCILLWSICRLKRPQLKRRVAISRRIAHGLLLVRGRLGNLLNSI